MSVRSAPARIAAIHDGMAEVHFEAVSACGNCRAQSVCGSGHTRTLQMPVPAGLHAGDHVSLQMPDAQLQLGALVAYLLPAFTTLLGGLLLAAGGDVLAALGATLGLGFGLVCLRLFARHGRLSGSPLVVCHSVCHSDSFSGETQ